MNGWRVPLVIIAFLLVLFMLGVMAWRVMHWESLSNLLG